MDKQLPRLSEDLAASATLRSDMTHARDDHRAYAAAYDVAAGAAALQAALAASSAAAGASTAGASAAAHVKLGGWAKALLGIASASALVLSGAALHAGWQARTRAIESPAAPATTPSQPTAQPVHALPSPARPQSAPEAQPSKRSSVTRNVATSPSAHEARQLARIRAYLQGGDPTRALALAERGQRELGESVLWQEREALAVLALLDLHREGQATKRARALIDRYPESPFRAEIEQRLSDTDAR